MNTIGLNELKTIFDGLKKLMDEKREYLIELDGVMGDSDLGITMQKAFTAANEEVQSSGEQDLGKLLMKTGMKIAQAAPSTMGTLVATGFMKGGKALFKTETISSKELAVFFRAFTQGIMDAGKTVPGNKTIVDALHPATLALEDAASGNKSIPEALKLAYEAAIGGVEASKQMKAQHGRAAYYQDKSIGVQDPGATVGAFIFQAFSEAANSGK